MDRRNKLGCYEVGMGDFYSIFAYTDTSKATRRKTWCVNQGRIEHNNVIYKSGPAEINEADFTLPSTEE